MSQVRRMGWAVVAVATIGLTVLAAQTPVPPPAGRGAQPGGAPPVVVQPTMAPTNDLPNPYETIEGFFKMPEGRTWGSTSAVDVSPDGKIVWVAERCAANTCWDAT